MEKMEDMENRNKNQETVKTVKTDKTDSAFFSESLKSLKSLMQIFVESAKSAKSAKSIFATSATSASANFVGKASNESTVRYRVKSRIPSCYLRSASVLHPFRLRLHPLRMVATLLLLLCLSVGEVWGTTATFTFNTAAGLTELGITKPSSDGSATNLSTDGNYVRGNITMTITHGSTNTRIWRTAGKNPGILDLRVYASGGSLTFAAASGYSISGISISGSGLTNFSANTGTYSSGSWSGTATSVTFTASNTVNINTITVTYSSSCTAINPSVTYSATTLYKGETASVSSITGNTGSASVTYSSSNSTVASVNPSTGVVTAGQAGTATITASFAATGSYCAKDVEITFTVRYRVKWSVNGNDSYTTGSPTTYISTHNTKVSTLPTAPSISCGGKTFVGWTATADYSNASTAPGDLFATAAGAPAVTSNVTYYAVFADAEENDPTYTKVTSVSVGTYVMVSECTTSTYKYMPNTTSDDANPSLGSGITMSTTAGVTTLTNSVTDDMLWDFSTGETSGYYYIRPHGSTTEGLGTNSSTGKNIRIGEDYVDDEWRFATSASYGWEIYNGHYLAVFDDSAWRNYSDNSTNQNGTFYLFKKSGGTTYSNYVTSCCTELGSINGSVSWSGGNTATLTWNKMSNVAASTPYTVTCKNGASSAGTVGSIDLSGSKATCSITGLTAGTTYTFKIEVSAATNYCDKDSTMTSIAPKITATTDANLVDATYAEGSGPSTNASYFTFSGVGLTGDVTVTAPTNFLVSKTSSSSGFGSSVTISPSTGSITNQKIWIRLASGLTNASSPYGGNVALSGGGAATVNVAITGSVTSACTEPTVATPTLTSIASGTITPSCASVTVDDNCDVTDYGFVWKASSDPTIDDNKTSLGDETPASAFSSDLSISFNTGNTYKIKAYAINSAGTTLSSTLTVTPQSVTFNSNGGSDVDAKYVNSGTKVTAPSAPTKTGYDFAGWQLNSSDFDFAKTNVSSDITLDATWNANSYDVTLSSNSGSGSDQTVSATYDDDMPLVVKTAGTAIVIPTRTGYDFGGYYNTSAASGGTQYYTYTGNPKALGSARNWDVANSTTTLYARWTPHQHKVSVSAVDHGTITATPAGGSAISEGSYNATVDYDKTVTLGWTKDDHYNTLVWTVHKDGDESTTVTVTGSGNGATFTMPDYDVVVKATISEDPYTLVTFKNNGTVVSGYENVKYYSGRPTAPTMTDGHSTGDACDEDSEIFYGWTADSWEYKISKSAASAKTIYKKGDNLPTVAASGDEVVYNAVWAEEVEGEDYILVSDLSNLKEGDVYFAAYASYSGSRWYGVTDASTFTAPITVTDNVITTTGLMKFTLVATGNTNEWYIKNGTKYLSGSGDKNDLSLADDACAWLMDNINASSQVQIRREVSSSYHYIRAGVGSTTSGKFRTYTSSGQNVSVFLTGTDLGNFMTHCCEDLITLGTPSISNGTIEYDWDSPVPTCNSGKTVTATITPSTGYKVTALTFSGGDVSYDDPDFPITSATNVSLTFAKNTDAATLSASATTAAIPVTSLKLRAQQTGQDDKIGNDLTMNCYPKEGQTGGNDPLNHTLKVLFEEVLPSNALDKTYDWSVRVKAKDDADWTDVSFTSNTLNTNSIINSFNKSTGALQIKSTEGTAEIKITAHDGSGVTAKVTITVANVALSNLGVSKSSTTLYVGQSEAIDVSYTPLNTTTKGYTTGSYSYVTIGNTNAVLTLTGKAATSEQTETVTLTSKDTGGKTATVTVTVKPLPTAIFVDLIHNKVDFANSGDGWTAGTGVLSSTASEGVVSHTKKTPTHDDLDAPGTGNDCEKTHLHLVGWIRSDYSKVADYLDGTGDVPTVSDLTTAGAGYWFLPNADINVETLNGKIFYAVWATVE